MLTDEDESLFICGRFSSCDFNYYDIRGFKYLFSENLYIFARDKRYLFHACQIISFKLVVEKH